MDENRTNVNCVKEMYVKVSTFHALIDLKINLHSVTF